ncbi:phage tail tape measure protein [Streptomyces sp. NPDC002917]|uniref:phage tail tape measure protein n=1 Tax=Streptomyces sp. NPDC002917 TaxID=3364671 RepID=UPI0036786026
MALNVGELAATISVDDGQGAAGLRKFEGRLKSTGDKAVATADTIGKETGEALGDGLAEGAEEGAEQAAEGMGAKLRGFAAATIGAGIGAALMEGLAQAVEQEQITAKLGAQLGQTPAEAKRLGEIAGDLYAGAITADFQTAADAIKETMGAGLLPPDATNAQIQSISTKVADLAGTFDQELGGVTNAVSQLMRTGLASSANEAFDIIAAGFGTSANKADDLLETINEYSVQWKRVGLDGQTALGLIDQAIKAGARDSDQVADAIGQFGELALSSSQGVKDAFTSIGLNADTMSQKIGKGGKDAESALQQTLDALRGTKDEQVKLNAATALFGDPGTVMGAALFALDPATAAASSGMDKAAGSTNRLGQALHETAGARIEKLKRGFTQGFVEILGNTVVPILEKFAGYVSQNIAVLGPLAGVVLGVAAAIGVWSVAQAIFNVVMAANPIVLIIGAIIGLIAVIILAYQHSETFRTIVQTAWETVKAVISTAIDGIAIAINWFAGLPAMLGRWFGEAKDWAIAKFVELVLWLVGLPGRALTALQNLGASLRSAAKNGFIAFKDMAVTKATDFVAWVRGLPKRIITAIGNLKTLLADKGKDLIRGLLAGVRSMGSWLRSQLMSFAKAMIPGPIAEALGIHSPSRLLADKVGQWIPAGIAKGAEDNVGVLDRTMRNLVSVPTPRAATAAAVAAQAGRAPGGAVGGGAIVLDVTGADGDMKRLIRRMVRLDGRGSVQTAFGT